MSFCVLIYFFSYTSFIPLIVFFICFALTYEYKEEEEEGIVLADLSVGVVSVGDVLLNNLKQHIEAAGITVEFRLTASGGVLVCGSQVSEYLNTAQRALVSASLVSPLKQ